MKDKAGRVLWGAVSIKEEYSPTEETSQLAFFPPAWLPLR